MEPGLLTFLFLMGGALAAVVLAAMRRGRGSRAPAAFGRADARVREMREPQEGSEADLLFLERGARAQAEQRAVLLSEEARLKQEFVASIGSEISTPLAALQASTRALRRELVAENCSARELRRHVEQIELQSGLIARVLQELESGAAEAASGEAGRSPGDRAVVLIVEDEATILGILSALVEDTGYCVQRVADGEAALGLLDRFTPALVLADVRLPGMDGLELARRIKARPGGGGIPVVLMSAYREPEDHVADCFLSKPFNLDDLVGLLGRYAPVLGGPAESDQPR